MILLAKSTSTPDQPPEQATLLGHTAAVCEAFRTIFGEPDEPTRTCRKWLEFFGMDDSALCAFHRNTLASCILHDIGKANTGFQKAVRRNGEQAIRHEHLSGLILWLPAVHDHFAESLDLPVVASAVIGHHLKADKALFGVRLNPDIDRFKILPEGVGNSLQELARQLDLPQHGGRLPEAWSFAQIDGYVNIPALKAAYDSDMTSLKRHLRRDKERHRLLMAVRAALILADSAGSGLAREGESVREWLKAAFEDHPLVDAAAIEAKVITPRIAQLTKSGRFTAWNGFQDAAEHLPSRSLLLAPCGSGKTLAAWRWIKAQCSARPQARVIFLYPTRATATEGFRDYVSWAPEADAALIHSTSAYELAGMFKCPNDARAQRDFTTQDRLFALAYWQRRIFSATVDQFLGFMQHSYRSTCLLPLLADSVVVIDEVHSFDRSLFSALRRFLQAFTVPVLCMTASLPEQRLRDLTQDCGLHRFPEDDRQFEDLRQVAEMPRYAAETVCGESEAETTARAAFDDGKRILWVANTVSRCQQIARRLHATCYHSRFRLQDRKTRHSTVIGGFQRSDRPLLAVTTQVCEMSLDLDADVLVTESAPITSLIQRMGRCNRHARPGEARLGRAVIYQPPDERPYDTADLEGADAFVRAIDGKQISQAHLQQLLEEYGPSAPEPDKYAAFLESKQWAVSREASLRDDGDFTVDAVLDSDVDEYLRLLRRKQPADGLILPVPKRHAIQDPRLGQRCKAAPGARYDPLLGFIAD